MSMIHTGTYLATVPIDTPHWGLARLIDGYLYYQDEDAEGLPIWLPVTTEATAAADISTKSVDFFLDLLMYDYRGSRSLNPKPGSVLRGRFAPDYESQF